MQPTFFDYAVVFILLASGVLGVLRGLVREVLSLIGWVVAFWVAFRYGAVAAGWMPESLPGGELARHALGFVVLLIGTVLGPRWPAWWSGNCWRAPASSPPTAALDWCSGCCAACCW